MSKSDLTFLILLISITASAQIEDFSGTDFSKADSVAGLYPHHSLKNLPDLSNKLTKSLSTQQQKFRAIYMWTCNNIENDIDLFEQNKRKREKLKTPEELSEWNQKLGKAVFKKLLTDKKTICTGYAYLIKELSYHAGLNCFIVDGYGRTAQANIGGSGTINHSWNAIQLNGKWYLCDATWSSGAIDTEKSLFVKKFDDCYFSRSIIICSQPLSNRFFKGAVGQSSNAERVFKQTTHL